MTSLTGTASLWAARSARPKLPAAPLGARVGLFGGSFDPPHAGHAHAALTALRRLRLDRIWWLVTPGNPLKDTGALPPIEARMAAARRLARHPRAVVSDIEARLGTRYTADLVAALAGYRPDLSFVLVIGADNWAGFHRWQHWRAIAATVSIAVVDRPGATLRALASPAARALHRFRRPERDAARLGQEGAPDWVFLTGHRIPLSSTMLRARAAGAGNAPS